jgi:hypothetical protein
MRSAVSLIHQLLRRSSQSVTCISRRFLRYLVAPFSFQRCSYFKLACLIIQLLIVQHIFLVINTSKEKCNPGMLLYAVKIADVDMIVDLYV